MAIFTGTFLTFSAKGIREDLSDAIYNISPEETPLVSMLAKEGCKNSLFEWQTDSLAAVDTANAQLEGDDIATVSTVSPTVRVGNHQQISRKTFAISGTEEAVDKAGRRSERAYQAAKKGAEIKRDIESIVFQNQGGDAGGSATARKTATLGAWVKTNVDLAGDGANPAWTSGVPTAGRTDGTQRAFTETILKSVIQKGWTTGATIENKYLFVGPVNKQKVSAFTGVVTRNYDISNRPRPTAVIAAVDVYVSDFGSLQVVPSRFQRERDAWIIDPEFMSMPHLRPFRVIKLAKTGDAEKEMLLVEWGVKVRNEGGLALAADLTTT